MLMVLAAVSDGKLMLDWSNEEPSFVFVALTFKICGSIGGVQAVDNVAKNAPIKRNRSSVFIMVDIDIHGKRVE